MKNENNSSLIIILVILLIVAGVLLYFLFKPKEVITIGFNTNYEKKIENAEIYKGDYIELPTLERDNYQFLGWYIGEAKIDSNYKFDKSITINAKWQEKEYELSFDTDGGNEIESIKVKCGLIMLPASPTKTGFTFLEWQDVNGKKVDNNSTLECTNQTIKAVWQKNEKSFTVTFDSDGGSSVSKQSVKEGGKATKPADPTKSGFIFNEWQLDGKTYNFDNVIDKDITLKATWKNDGTKKTHKVTFITDRVCLNCSPVYSSGAITNCIGGGCSDVVYKTIDVVDGTKVTKPTNPTKKGYTFKEWQLNGKTYDFNSAVTSDLKLIAYWINNTNVNYTVKFDSDGGTAVSSQTIKSGEKVKEPANPTKNGYTFKEWQLNGTKYNFNNAVISDITLKAVWEKKTSNNYTISLSYGNVKSLSVKCNEKIADLPKLTSTQTLIFIGWFDKNDKQVRNGDVMPCQNLSLSAKFYDVSTKSIIKR